MSAEREGDVPGAESGADEKSSGWPQPRKDGGRDVRDDMPAFLSWDPEPVSPPVPAAAAKPPVAPPWPPAPAVPAPGNSPVDVPHATDVPHPGVPVADADRGHVVPASATAPDGGLLAPSSAGVDPVADESLSSTLGGEEFESRGLLSALRDNVEAVAFALILALLLRHCVIEVFKIPTPSMAPTLFGENSREHPGTPGDRILVDKFAYLFHDPERCDVVVFHYPLDWSRDFIKRVWGLPGETFRIERGDFWVGKGGKPGVPPVLHPARKRRNVREQLYTPIYPPAASHADRSPSDWWASDGGTGLWQVPEHGKLVYEGGGPADAASVRRYAFPIRDTDRDDLEPGTGSMYTFTPDVRVRCRVTADAPAEVELQWKPGDGRRHVLRLASEGRAPSAAIASGTTHALPQRLVPGKPVNLELESVDGDLRAWVGGSEVAVIADEIPIERAIELQGGVDPGTAALTISVVGGRVVFDHVRVDHDLYYTNYRDDGLYLPAAGETKTLGDDEFFMLGDNTRQSSDSRRWKAQIVTLRDGTKIAYDPAPASMQSQPRHVTIDGNSLKEVTDVEGVTRRWSADEEENGMETRPMPFVKRERIVGRAWFALVFWPLEEVWPRLRFVH